MNYLQSFLGVCFFLGVCVLLSENRAGISFRSILVGVLAQILLATIMLKVEYVRSVFISIGSGIVFLKDSTLSATSFVFGYIGGGELPFIPSEGSNTFSLAFQALPMIFVISSISMLLFHFKILPKIINALSPVVSKTLNIGGVLAMCSIAKVFLGQIEAGLVIKPYIKHLKRGEIFTMMVLGTSTTSVTVMGVYASLLSDIVPDVISHVLTSSIINIPIAVTISKIIIPEESTTGGECYIPYKFLNTIDAITTGAIDSIKVFLNIIALLISFITILTSINHILSGTSVYLLDCSITLESALGFVLQPVAWLIGFSWEKSQIAAELIGTKVILNEIYTFSVFAKEYYTKFDEHSRVLIIYSLCGFANIANIGIQIGGFSAMAPERRNEIVNLGSKAMIAGAISTFFSATIISNFI